MRLEIPLEEFEQLDPEPQGYAPYTTRDRRDVMRLEPLVLEGWLSDEETQGLKKALKAERQRARELEQKRIEHAESFAENVADALLQSLVRRLGDD
ncbi:MAG: hypothetical protein AAF194_07310 [Pseudomonadota bacterium]